MELFIRSKKGVFSDVKVKSSDDKCAICLIDFELSQEVVWLDCAANQRLKKTDQ